MDSLVDIDRYLGDGVYASHDEYQIWLAVNHHLNKAVALEPSVVMGLIQYAIDNKVISSSDLKQFIEL